MTYPLAHIQTTKVHAEVNDESVTALIEKNNIIIVEDTRKLQQAYAGQKAAIESGKKMIVLSAAAVLEAQRIIKREKRYRRCSFCCFFIALILAIAFGIEMGLWKSNANELQTLVIELRDELQSDVFYTEYDKLVDKCLNDNYSVCYDIGIYTILRNPSYDDVTGVILSLAKNPQNTDECLLSSDYQCIVRYYTYYSSASTNCRASEYKISSDCEAVLTDSHDSCTAREIISVSGGGSYFSSSENCHVEDVSTLLENGTQVACNDCAVVTKLENVIQKTQNLF